MPFLSPNQQCQSTEGNNVRMMITHIKCYLRGTSITKAVIAVLMKINLFLSQVQNEIISFSALQKNLKYLQ